MFSLRKGNNLQWDDCHASFFASFNVQYYFNGDTVPRWQYFNSTKAERSAWNRTTYQLWEKEIHPPCVSAFLFMLSAVFHGCGARSRNVPKMIKLLDILVCRSFPLVSVLGSQLRSLASIYFVVVSNQWSRRCLPYCEWFWQKLVNRITSTTDLLPSEILFHSPLSRNFLFFFQPSRWPSYIELMHKISFCMCSRSHVLPVPNKMHICHCILLCFHTF